MKDVTTRRIEDVRYSHRSFAVAMAGSNPELAAVAALGLAVIKPAVYRPKSPPRSKDFAEWASEYLDHLEAAGVGFVEAIQAGTPILVEMSASVISGTEVEAEERRFPGEDGGD